MIDPNALLSATYPQRCIYRNISYNKSTSVLESIAIKWSTMLSNNITPDTMSVNFMSIYKTTVNNKLRAFMYKYFHLKLFLNPELKRMNLYEVDTCTFCKSELETYNHLFVSCRFVSDLWASLGLYCLNRFNLVLNIASVEDIMSLHYLSKDHIIIQLLCFITMYYIYRCRLTKSNPTSTQLYREFYRIEYLECEIAKSNNKYYVHKQKWHI